MVYNFVELTSLKSIILEKKAIKKRVAKDIASYLVTFNA